jgi:hypothetical protein
VPFADVGRPSPSINTQDVKELDRRLTNEAIPTFAAVMRDSAAPAGRSGVGVSPYFAHFAEVLPSPSPRLRGRRRLAPTEDKPLTWPQDPNAADLEDGAVGQCFDEAPALTGFAGRAGYEPEQWVGYPPDPDVTREYLEGARG